jgi:hypothetical protein
MYAAVGFLAVLAAARIAPTIHDAATQPTGAAGADFRMVVYGPNALLAEHLNPWSLEASVPRFGPYPTPPVAPSSLLLAPLVTGLGVEVATTTWIALSVVLVVLGTWRIARSLGLTQAASMLLAGIVLLSPAGRYDIELGQLSPALIAAVAYFAVSDGSSHARWWHRAERGLYLLTTLYFFPKPTVALTLLAAELAYRRSARLFVRSVAAVAVVSVAMMAWIVERTGTGLGDLFGSLRATARVLGDLPVNRMAGDRVDLLSLVHPSPLLDIVFLAVVGAALWFVHRTNIESTLDRLLLGVGVVTLFTYHHYYDTLPFLALLLVAVTRWPNRQRIWLAAGLAITGSLPWSQRVVQVWSDATGIGSFPLGSRLLFVLGVGVLGWIAWRHLCTRRNFRGVLMSE